MKAHYKRVLIKISGEAFSRNGTILDKDAITYVANEIESIYRLGVEIAIMVGGGNIYRGLHTDETGIQRTTGDYIGMLAHIINGLALEDILNQKNIPARVQSALEVRGVTEPFILKRTLSYLSDGKVIIFTAGTGNPYFTSDTGAALRANQIQAELVIKATKVNGVYEADPEIHADTKKYDHLNYLEVINRKLRALDHTAITLCMENDIPITVLKLASPGNLCNCILGKKVGTRIDGQA